MRFYGAKLHSLLGYLMPCHRRQRWVAVTETLWLSKQQIFAILPVTASSGMSEFSCKLHEAGAGLVLITDVFMVPSPESGPLRGDGGSIWEGLSPWKNQVRSWSQWSRGWHELWISTHCLHLFVFPVFSFPSTWFGVKTQEKIFYFHNSVL